jgi:hypothetical protein
MLGKIALEIPCDVRWAPKVSRIVDSNYWRTYGQIYLRRVDLRAVNIPGILHLQNRWTGDHKFEFIESDQMRYTEMLTVLSQVIKCEPELLRLHRLDLSADVPKRSVDWFHTHTYVPRKRTHQVYGKQSKSEDQRTNGIYFGGKHDCIRIYDKLGERAFRHREPHFPFARWADSLVPVTVTRVERQLRGDRIPSSLRQFGSLLRAAEYNPFDQFRFKEPCRLAFGRVTVGNTLKAMGLARVIEKDGPQAAKSILNTYSHGNASRFLKRLIDVEPEHCPDLYTIYRDETRAQLEAA